MYDVGVLVAMLVCLITYAVYVQTLRDFQPQNTYEVYDSLGGAQAHVLLPKKVNPLAWNSKCCSQSKYLQLLCVFLSLMLTLPLCATATPFCTCFPLTC